MFIRRSNFGNQIEKDKVEEPEDIFRKTVACSLKILNGEHMKEYAKLKI